MKNANKQIKIASILYLFSSLLFVPFAPAFGTLLLILGAILLANSFLSLEELKKNKVSLIIIMIISFLLNVPAAVFIILSLDEISNVKLEKSNAPPTTESKRIDTLLKLGLVMILISGVLFATTTWEIISNLIKVIALVGMGAIFLGLSKFSEVKLKIESTTKAYYILGLSFFLLTWVGIGYFGVISPWFSYSGEGSHLVYFITLIILGIFLYRINYKFKEKEYLYMGHMSIYLGIYHALAATGLDLLQVSVVLSIISLIINIIPKSKLLSTIKDINYPISYLFSAIIITQCFEANKYVVLVACIINVGNVLLLSLTQKSAFNQVISTIINYMLLTIATLKLDLAVDNAITLFSVISVFSLLLKYQKINQSNWLVSTSQILYHLIATILIIIIASYSKSRALIISTIYLCLNVVNSLNLYKEKDQVDFRYQPLVIMIFFCNLLSFINNNLVAVGDFLYLALSTFTYAVIYHFIKKTKIKQYYSIVLLVALILTFLCNLAAGEIVIALTTLLLTTYLFFTRKKEEAAPRIILYIAVLLNIIVTTSILTNYAISPIITHIITLIVFVVLTALVKDKQLKVINYISIVVPLYNLVYLIDMADNWTLVITNIFWLYILFLIVKFIVKNKMAKDLVSTIGLAIITLSIIFETDIFIGIYIGILSIAIIFATFNAEHYKKLFYCGIIITIVNIVVQLWEFWTQIPFYLYLLLVGVAIVAFVTYKELHKQDVPIISEKQPDQIEQQEMPSSPKNSIDLEKKSGVEVSVTLPQEESVSKEEIEQLEQNTNTVEQLHSLPSVVKYCPSCGRENHGGKFCRTCGRNLQR